MNKSDLNKIPQIEILLQSPDLASWFPRLSRPLVARLAADETAKYRKLLLSGEVPANPAMLWTSILRRCREIYSRRLQPVVNATGVLLHTNLGRSPLADNVWEACRESNTGYCNLEFDLTSGERGGRGGLAGELLCLLLGAERALIVNNNAAALLLTLTALAGGRDVIVSRGEQVQIGGGFRIPEILALSGAHLVEVGTTNVTRLSDYTDAIRPETAMVLVVHTSNFRIRGFTERPTLRQLASALPNNVHLVVDQGSGATDEGLPGEESAAHCLKSGADLVCFSADKLLGGPQAGLVVGNENLLSKLESHPLLRALRPGKTIYSLLEESLVRRLNGELESPIRRAFALTREEFLKRGQLLLEGLPAERTRLVPSLFMTGGGSAPDEEFPGLALELTA
ncbi:MAG: L-seryl-tRNA(Sec) selenium transferase, partial [Rectinemataceae bacterium]|nr:L-seryl-tRNA(Sec) selenium transferase [Rectinemataceae bacterium]